MSSLDVPEDGEEIVIELSEEAEGALPAVYGQALRLEEAGLSAPEIAERLDVAPESVPLLLDLARRKRKRRVSAKHAKG